MSAERKMPTGWEMKKLGEVCDFQNGFAFKSSTYKQNGFPVLRISNIQNERIDTTDIIYIDANDYSVDLTPFYVKHGDILIAMSGGTTGKIGINTTDTVFLLNQRVGKFIPNECISKEYFYYFVSTKCEESLSISAGSAQPNLSTEQIKSFVIPLPPLPEQKRIVAILDETFQAIEKAKENAQKNLANARELFESYLNQIFSNPGKDWEERKLGEVCDIKHGFAFDGIDFSVNDDSSLPIVLTPGNFTEDSNLSFTSKNTKRLKSVFSKEWLFELNELVVVMTDLSSKMKILGKPAIINHRNILHNQRIGRVIFKSSDITQRFLYFFLQTRKYQENIKRTATGTMVKHTAPKRILENTIIYPVSESEQMKLINTIDSLHIQAKRLESIYQQKLAALDELKKSILKKAFSGEL